MEFLTIGPTYCGFHWEMEATEILALLLLLRPSIDLFVKGRGAIVELSKNERVWSQRRQVCGSVLCERGFFKQLLWLTCWLGNTSSQCHNYLACSSKETVTRPSRGIRNKYCAHTIYNTGKPSEITHFSASRTPLVQHQLASDKQAGFKLAWLGIVTLQRLKTFVKAADFFSSSYPLWCSRYCHF